MPQIRRWNLNVDNGTHSCSDIWEDEFELVLGLKLPNGSYQHVGHFRLNMRQLHSRGLVTRRQTPKGLRYSVRIIRQLGGRLLIGPRQTDTTPLAGFAFGPTAPTARQPAPSAPQPVPTPRRRSARPQPAALTWRAGQPLHPRAQGSTLDATFHLDTLPNGAVSLVLESRGGSPGNARNRDYNKALSLLLRRLGTARVQLLEAFVDSTHTARLPLAARRLSLPRPYPIELSALPTGPLDTLRTQLGAAMAAIGRAPGAKGGGNRTKRLRLVLGLPAPAPRLDALAQQLVQDALPSTRRELVQRQLTSPSQPPVNRVAERPAPSRPSHQPPSHSPPAPPTPPQATAASATSRPSMEELAQRVLTHLRDHGSLSERQLHDLAGSPRRLRRLRNYLESTPAPLRIESTPRGQLWRLA